MLAGYVLTNVEPSNFAFSLTDPTVPIGLCQTCAILKPPSVLVEDKLSQLPRTSWKNWTLTSWHSREGASVNNNQLLVTSGQAAFVIYRTGKIIRYVNLSCHLTEIEEKPLQSFVLILCCFVNATGVLCYNANYPKPLPKVRKHVFSACQTFLTHVEKLSTSEFCANFELILCHFVNETPPLYFHPNYLKPLPKVSTFY